MQRVYNDTDMTLEGETLRLEGVLSTTGEEVETETSSELCDEATEANPLQYGGTSAADGASCERRHISLWQTLKIGT